MAFRRGQTAALLAATAFLGLSSMAALASEAAPPPPKPTPKKVTTPSGLTGNIVPRCDPGKVAGGNVCKNAPPGYYAPGGVTYAIACPKGAWAPAGSRALGECFYPGGKSAAIPLAIEEKPKSGH